MPAPIEPRARRAADRDASVTAAARAITRRIRRHGPITFADFMERALYDPRHGYYSGVPAGPRADYITGPQVHRAFGRAVARLASEVDAALERPDVLHLVEVGSGDGTLLRDAADALQAEHPGTYARARLVSIERSRAHRRAQRQRLAPHSDRTSWLAGLDELAGLGADGELVGGVWSNELVDAMPVHRVVGTEAGFEEVLVDVEDGRFVERRAAPSTDRLQAYLERNHVRLAPGQVAEICLAAGAWLQTVAAALRRGFVLTLDYGAPTELLYAPDNVDGSLVCQRRFRLGADPYLHVGEQDITAHVDFGNLVRRGEEHGLRAVGLVSLAAFLVGFGAAEGAGLQATGDAADHLALRHLLFSEIGTAHRALLQVKGLELTAIAFGRTRLEG